MTKATLRETDFAKLASLDRKSLTTLLLAVADQVDEDRGERIRELRRAKGDPPQPVVAAAIGVSLRSYQAWEAGNGIRFDNREALAAYFEVPLAYIMNGPTPDHPMQQQPPLGSMNSIQLDRIEKKLDDALSRPSPPPEFQEALELLRQLAAAGPSRRPAGGGSRKAGGASPG